MSQDSSRAHTDASVLSAAEERRTDERRSMDGQVSVRLVDDTFVGPGQNISRDGIFFVAESSLKVLVDTGEGSEPLEGELVRVQSMGEGQVGIAVRFLGPSDPE